MARIPEISLPDDDPVLGNYLEPAWDRAGRCHDWRNHIDDTIQDIWSTFTPHQRRVLAEEAQHRAGMEEWD